MIGILNAYHFETAAEYQKEYSQLFLNFVKEVFPEKSNEVAEYKVAQGFFPKSTEECEVWFITGSPKSVYDDIPWVHQLKAFTQELHQKKKKTIGICFGHQMVAHALGGEVIQSPRGWGVGVRKFEVLSQESWMSKPAAHLSLLFSHQDQVVKMPPSAKQLASDAFCPFQMMQIEEHILTMQGHPEFSVSFARDRLVSRKTLVDHSTFETAMASYSLPTNDKTLVSWVREFVLKSQK